MRRRSWTEDQLRVAVSGARSVRQILKKLGLKMAGGNYCQIKKYLNIYHIECNLKGHGWSKGLKGIGSPRQSLQEIMVEDSYFQSHKLKKRLFKEKIKEQRCEECGWSQLAPDGRLPLELDHINGNSRDNRLENLRVLCPNCHSLKPTNRGRNRKKAQNKAS